MTRFSLRSLSLAVLCLLICISGHRAKGQDTNSTASSDPAPNNQTADDTTSASDTGVDGTTTTGPISDSPMNDTTATEPIATSDQGGAVPDNTTSETSAPDAPPAGDTGSASNFSTSEVPTEATTESPPPTSDDQGNSTSSAEPPTVHAVTNEAAAPENGTTSPAESVTSQETTSEPAETTGATETTEVSEQTTSTATTQSTGTTTSEPGTTSVQTFTPAGKTTAASQSQEEEAEAEAVFVIKDKNDKPCLLASLDFTIRVLYIDQQGQNQTYEASLPDPKDVTVAGSCGKSSSSLQLAWNNTTFALNLAFVLSGPGNRSSEEDASPEVTENTNYTWSLSEISLTYDTSDVSVFPGASDRKVQTATVRDLNLFSTPLGQSYVCHEAQLLSMELQGARLEFNWVHLMPFGVNGTRFSAEAENCQAGGASESAPGQQDAYLIPLIVACSLAALVVIIVLGYAISRCVTRHQRQSEYKQMP